jgi:hypothetical protein
LRPNLGYYTSIYMEGLKKITKPLKSYVE